MSDVIYLDNAATSWPKPPAVVDAMQRFMHDVGANPGRSGHRRANAAERVRFDAREALAELFGVSDPMRVVFTLNATTALNMVIAGLLPPGSHVITSGIEHNAVVRPLRAREAMGVKVTVVPCTSEGWLDPTRLAEHFTPATRLVVVNHASNVCGTVLDVRAIGTVAREHGVPLLVDAAQTAGVWPIDLATDHIDLLAFAGHKGPLGPPGTGGLVLADDFPVERLPALIHGGTGSRSEHEQQPEFLPDKYEAGTPNIAGLAGLAAGVRHVLKLGALAIREMERRQTAWLLQHLGEIDGVEIVGPTDPMNRTAVVSVRIRGRAPSDVAGWLDEERGILVRPGLHCAPAAHRTLGTFPAGTIRLAPGLFTQDADLTMVVEALAERVRLQ